MSDDYQIERLERKLNDELKRHGRFTIDMIIFHLGESKTLFRKYLKSNVQKGTLISEKDEIGRIWYSKPD